MKCRECQQECDTVEHLEPFWDDAYGARQLYNEVYLYSTCCLAEVDEDDEV